VEIHQGCGQLADEQFVRAFEQCRLPPGTFHHADHIRLAWIYVCRHGSEGAEARLLTGLRKMALQANAPQKFLHTATIAWTRLVAAAQCKNPEMKIFEDWVKRHAHLLDRTLLCAYYSAGRLETEAARSGWLEPDLAPLDG
jgi:hypothetical protein